MDFSDREFSGDVDAVRDANPPVSCDPPTLEVRAGRPAALLWLHTLLFSI